MILSHRHKFIFFCNGKTGSTSIEAALRPYQEGAEYDVALAGLFPKAHIPPVVLKAFLPERIWRNYYKVVFVRNPWDWFVSSWFYNSAWLPPPAAGPQRRDLPTRVRRRLSAIANKLDPRARRSPAPPPLLCTAENADHLFRLLRPFRGVPSARTCTQTAWAYDADGHRIVDFVGRFENIEADFAKMCLQVGISAALPHLNRTDHQNYRHCFTPEGRERVLELWSMDVRNFDYTF